MTSIKNLQIYIKNQSNKFKNSKNKYKNNQIIYKIFLIKEFQLKKLNKQIKKNKIIL